MKTLIELYDERPLDNVLATEMFRAGMQFYQAENGVWLTDTVPPAYLERND